MRDTPSRQFDCQPYYADETVAIYHGDSRELLPAEPLEALLLSDPPYGMNYEHGARKGGRKMGMDGHSIVGDQEPFDPLLHRNWSRAC